MHNEQDNLYWNLRTKNLFASLHPQKVQVTEFCSFGSTHLCSSLSICLAREILFLMEDMKFTSTGNESRSFPRKKKQSNRKLTNISIAKQTHGLRCLNAR